MKILVTNDDGIFAEGLWTLAGALKDIAEVVVVAPDKERSAIGTAVTLRQPLKVKKISPPISGIETYSVEGTPADSVILALGKLVKDKVHILISGINQGANLGDDVFISGTVSAARQGYLYGLPALAISTFPNSNLNLRQAAKLARVLIKKMRSHPPILLNINLPDLPLEEIKGIEITKIATRSHTDTVEEEDGRENCYRLVRERMNLGAPEGSDIWAIEKGRISITPLHNYYLNSKRHTSLVKKLCSNLLDELKRD